MNMKWMIVVLLLTACVPIQPSLNVAAIAAPTPPKFVAPAVEAGVAAGRLYMFGGYEAVIQPSTPAYGPVFGVSFRMWP